MAVIDLKEKFGHIPEMRELFELISQESAILRWDQEPPVMTTTYDQAQEILSARVADMLSTPDTLDDLTQRLSLRAEGKGEEVEWEEMQDESSQ